MKLTPIQSQAVHHMRQGFKMVTGEDMKEIIIDWTVPYAISYRTFYSLKDKGLIFQNFRNHFRYELTELGKSITLADNRR